MSIPHSPSSFTVNEKEAYDEFMNTFYSIYTSYPQLTQINAKTPKGFKGYEIHSQSFHQGTMGYYVNFINKKYLFLDFNLDSNISDLKQELKDRGWSMEFENVIIEKQ